MSRCQWKSAGPRQEGVSEAPLIARRSGEEGLSARNLRSVLCSHRPVEFPSGLPDGPGERTRRIGEKRQRDEKSRNLKRQPEENHRRPSERKDARAVRLRVKSCVKSSRVETAKGCHELALWSRGVRLFTATAVSPPTAGRPRFPIYGLEDRPVELRSTLRPLTEVDCETAEALSGSRRRLYPNGRVLSLRLNQLASRLAPAA